MILKGQTTSNDWLEFRIHNIIKCDQYWTHVWNMGEYVTINTDTIHLADDPRAESAELATLREQVKELQEALEACIDLLSNLENIGGFVGLAVINNGQSALDQTKPKDGK